MEFTAIYDACYESELAGLRDENARLRQENEGLKVEFRALQDEVGLYHMLGRPALERYLDKHPGVLEWPRFYEVLEWLINFYICDQQK